MSNAAKLKKRAVELEQKKQFDKALALYVQFLQESDGAIDDVDVPLYNRVGDLMLRMGNASDALNYYEKAVDLYAERGFLNNAIALCNKVLRQSPGRATIYYKLGKISATKGFKSDAKKNFLEYADRMQKAGQIDEAFRALKEFADLCPDQDDIRLMLAEQLSRENRQDEALEQLQKLHDKLDSEGRTAEARATVDRMKSIDPEAVPRTSGSYPPQKTSDLIFLDTSYEQAARPRHQAPAPSPVPSRQVSDPDLVVLTLADQHESPVSPMHNAAVSEAFALDVDLPNDVDAATVDLPLLDVADDLPRATSDAGGDAALRDLVDAVPMTADLVELTTADSVDASTGEEARAADARHVDPIDLGDALVPDDAPAASAPADGLALDVDAEIERVTLAMATEPDPVPSDLAATPSTFESGPRLSIDYAGDLALDVGAPPEDVGGDLFDFRSPPRGDDDGLASAPAGTLDPDVSFPSLELDDMSLPSADEVTSGASLAAALGVDLSLGSDLDALELPDGSSDAGYGLAAADALELESPSAGAGDERSVDEGSVAHQRTGAGDPQPTPAAATPVIEPAAAEGDVFETFETVAADDEAAGRAATGVDANRRAPDTTDDETAAGDSTAAVPSASETRSPYAPPIPSWQTRRQHAEQLLEAGDREAGVRELEQISAQLERANDLERALTIVDELIRLTPDAVRHHQKRVELTFRAGDRAKLTDAYIELGDALFRSGEELKARAVYQRVLELAPDDARARAAMESVASMSPPAGSSAIAAVPPFAERRESRHDARTAAAAGPASAPTARLDHAPPAAPSSGHASRAAASILTPQSPRKPSPLDRSAAVNGDFVDLGEWLRADESPKSTRMVTDEKPPTGDEQADFQEMLKRFKQGVADNVDDEDYDSHYDLGVAFKEMGLMDEAVAEFQKSLRSSTHRVRSYEALGQCFVEKEQYQVAASVLSRAIALGEGDDHHLVGVLYLLGRATEELSRDRDALDYYQRVFAVDIEFRDVAERISAIERKAT